MFTKIGLCLFTVLALYTALATARDMAVIFTPYQSPTEARQQVKTTLQFLTSLDPGDEAVLLDGYHLKTIGIFTIPENKAYSSVKARLGANKKVVGKLMRFAKSATVPDGVNQPTVMNAMRLPQLLRSLAENLSPEQPLDVIVLGSPFYDDPKEAPFSMAGGIFPSDSHLTHSRADTPFGSADNPDLLRNIRLHLGFADEAIFPTDQHRFYVGRFWTLYTEAQGGALVTFTGDLPTLFERVKRNASAPKHRYKLDSSEKLEMIRLRRKEVDQPIYERPITNDTLSLHQAIHADQLEIGITWDVDCTACDLDLYAALPGKEVLFFGKPVTPEGEHFKDFRQSPQSINGFETIAFNIPVDLSTLQLAVGFYSGKAPGGVNGEIRLSLGNDTFATPFHIAATKGVKDTAAIVTALNSGHSTADHVILIDPLKIVKTRTEE